MIDYEKLRDALNYDIKFTPEHLAELFCELDCAGMSRFFNEIHRLSSQWSGSFAQQMQFVTDSPVLSDDGRAIMTLIGDYAPKYFPKFEGEVKGFSRCTTCHKQMADVPDHCECPDKLIECNDRANACEHAWNTSIICLKCGDSCI